MPTLWLFDIEPHEQRYTVEWKKHLPQQIEDAIFDAGLVSMLFLTVIDGGESNGVTVPGAFVDFADSSRYKAHQIRKISKAFQAGFVKDGDRLLFTDAWHPGVIQCRYMADLFGIEVLIDVMWHAGSYDEWDLLGQKVRKKAWSHAFERAVFEAADLNYFATDFHRNLFIDVIQPSDPEQAVTVGWPMEYLVRQLGARAHGVKKDTFLFPHRLSPEKQPEIFSLLEPYFPNHRFVYAQKEPLTKEQYHDELARSAVVFSASLQETLGIAIYEGMLCGALAIIPDRLSYKEIYTNLGYPSEWTTSFGSAEANLEQLVHFIRDLLENRSIDALDELTRWAGRDFFDGRALYDHLLR